jgi:hypothetical protein
MMPGNPIEDRLRSVGLPEPEAGLRERVIARSVPALRSSTTWAERIWFSGRCRVAAVALLFTVTALDRVSIVTGPTNGEGPGVAAVETAQAAGDTARQAGLPDAVADLLERQALMAAAQPGDQERFGNWALDLGLNP